MYDHGAQMKRDARRQEIIREAMADADRKFDELTDASEEMSLELTCKVAAELLQIIALPSNESALCMNIDTPASQIVEKAMLKCRPSTQVLSKAERDFITSKIAEVWVNRAIYYFGSKLLSWEIENPAK